MKPWVDSGVTFFRFWDHHRILTGMLLFSVLVSQFILYISADLLVILTNASKFSGVTLADPTMGRDLSFVHHASTPFPESSTGGSRWCRLRHPDMAPLYFFHLYPKKFHTSWSTPHLIVGLSSLSCKDMLCPVSSLPGTQLIS